MLVFFDYVDSKAKFFLLEIVIGIYFRLKHSRDLEINALDRRSDEQQSDPIKVLSLPFKVGNLK